MKKSGLLGTSAIGSAAILGFLAFATPAYAQDNGAQETTESGAVAADEENPDAIVVTGSRIRRPNLDSPIPVTSISGEEFFQQGQLSVGDTLNELPALRSTFGQANAGRFLGTVGLNLLDLRGLGPQRTLVLVNGRRHVAADILANGVSPDVNTIPTDLIERVDVVTGGNSAIYGSDAIAGVVNFILRRDYEGLQIRGQGGLSSYGDAGNYYISAMYGHNFADGRANVTVHGEYAHQDIVYGRQRPFVAQNNAFIQVDSDPGGTPNGSDGNPDRIFFRDIRGANISSSGLVSFAQGAGTPACGVGPNGTPYNCVYQFTRDGLQLLPVSGTRVGFGPIGSFIGGDGATNRDENLITLYPVQDRYNVNLLAHFTVSDALEPFIEAKYARVETRGRSSGPAFSQGSSIDANRERIRLDNPFLTPAERTFIANQIIASGRRTNNLTSSAALTPADLTAIANGTFRFPIQKNYTDLGVRDEDSVRETYRIVGGLRGTFNDDWNYEVSVNYGRFEESTRVLGNINIQRFLLSIDAGRDPVTGQIRCRSQFDPAARINEVGDTAENFQRDIDACVPLNPFGRTDVSAARAYIVQDTVSRASLEQLVFSGFMAGDSSQWFELPGGPVRFALGAEYRRENAFYQADPLVENGFTFYNALPTFDPGSFTVKEAYGEIEFPIIRDTPFFEELIVRGAGRVADYNSGAGTVFSYNAGVEWAPIQDIRFRGNYSRAVRAPNVSETGSPLSQNFAPGFQDPCRSANIGSGTQFRAANCLSDLGAAGLASIANLPAYSLELVSGSNPDLESETSDSWTIGAVIQPRFIPGLSLTVDYYDITVDNVIQSPSAQNIVNTCYDLPDLNNQFCALFDRFAGPGSGPNDEVPGQILDTSLVVIPLNYAALKVRGLDFELNYRRNIEGWGNLSTRFIYTHVLQNSQFTNPAIPDFENRVLSELGDPQDEFLWSIDLQSGPVTVGYQMRYIGKQVLNLYEDYFSVQGRAPQDADYADRIYYPSVFYHDIRAAIDVNDRFNFYVGVDNLLNRAPPLGLTGTGAGSGIYSVRGRNFYAGFRARF